MSSISSISASTPPAPPAAVVQSPDASEAKGADPTADSDADDAGAAQPTALAPLPPGQGTRIDQFA